MSKPKFKMTIEEMLSFNDDCEAAASRCPQWRGQAVEDRNICLGRIKPKNLVKYWLRSDTLWTMGYHNELSVDAALVLEEYKEHKILLAAWKLTKGAA